MQPDDDTRQRRPIALAYLGRLMATAI